VVAYVQYWRDVPGQVEPKRGFVALGVRRTRTIAERKAAEKLEELGINSTQTFRESTSNITLRSRVKSGSNPSPTANVIPLNRRRSTHGDTPWTSGCIPSSVSGIWPTSPTSP
jgi:hypothetical protein